MISNRCLIALAACSELAASRHPTTVPEIAATLGVTDSYLEQIFAQLKGAGVIRGIRGPGGGYVLTQSPERISALDVMAASATDRKNPAGDPGHPALVLMMGQIESVLSEISLSDLAVREVP